MDWIRPLPTAPDRPDSGENTVDIFTDGACLGNPGPGGWGAVLRWRDTEKEIAGGEPQTTNNRMELQAAIAGLEAMRRPMRIRVHTDSTYVRDGITQWIHSWKANGWRTSAKKPVKNEDLWRRLDDALERHDVSWHWIKGHAGHPENERADTLARSAAEAARDAVAQPTGEF